MFFFLLVFLCLISKNCFLTYSSLWINKMTTEKNKQNNLNENDLKWKIIVRCGQRTGQITDLNGFGNALFSLFIRLAARSEYFGWSWLKQPVTIANCSNYYELWKPELFLLTLFVAEYVPTTYSLLRSKMLQIFAGFFVCLYFSICVCGK